MQTNSITDIILKKSWQFKDVNDNIDFPTVICKLSQDEDIIRHINQNSFNSVLSELENIGDYVFQNNVGNYKNEIQYYIDQITKSNQIVDGNLVRNHCKWLFTTLMDMVAFQKEESSRKLLENYNIKIQNYNIIESFINKRGIIFVSVYQNHIGFALTDLLTKIKISIIRKKTTEHNNSPLLGCFSEKINIIDADVDGGRKIFYELKNKNIVALYNDFLYPDSRAAKGLLFGNIVNVSETLLKIICLTNAVVIPFVIIKSTNQYTNEINVKFFDPIEPDTNKNANCFENILYKLSLGTELLIRYCPEQWRLWNSLRVRWGVT
jgi:lauroyl/myristoyl acyltransferase